MRGRATLAIVVSSDDMIDASMTETVMNARRGPSISAGCGEALLNATPCLRRGARPQRQTCGRASAYRRSHQRSVRTAVESLHLGESAVDERAHAGRTSTNCPLRFLEAAGKTAI